MSNKFRVIPYEIEERLRLIVGKLQWIERYHFEY